MMSKNIVRQLSKLLGTRRVLKKGEQGQSLLIITLAFIGLLALVGLGVDLGLVYVELVQVGRAADAAALAAATELPLESAAQARALVYLQENEYNHEADGVQLAVDTYHNGEYAEDPGGDTTIWVDTEYSQDAGQADTANRIRVRVRKQVPMNFMQFMGFPTLPAEATATAENISNIDTVIVYDKSGSMEFDTLCYGCWEPSSDPTEQYPHGTIYPLHWGDQIAPPPNHCAGWEPDDPYNPTDGGHYNCSGDDCYYEDAGEYHIIIEAEEYSSLSVNYSGWAFVPYSTLWVMQRNDRGSEGRDGRGGYLSHHPYANYNNTSGLGVACTWDDLNDDEKCRRGLSGGPFDAPRADYDFYAPVDGNYYVWLRGQGGGSSGSDDFVFWGMDGTPLGREDDFRQGPYYDGASSSRWDWERLSKGGNGGQDGVHWLSAGEHTLNLWAGGSGFDADRIIITTDNGITIDNNEELPPSGLPTGDPANNGRTDWACHPCDPRFAGRPGGQTSPAYRPDCYKDLRFDDLYDDEGPIRDALEAAKYFVGLLDPRFDQVGYVSYDTNSQIRNELECVRRLGTTLCTSQVITDTVLYQLDNTSAGGSTNIAEGIKDGIAVLSTIDSHYGRPGAAHIMALMTDGEANQTPDSVCDDDPTLWPRDYGNDGDPVPDSDDSAAKDCVIYYAQEARDNGIVIYTISLGWSADRALMEEVADITGGYHRWAPTPDKLEEIFDELYERIFIRLIQ